MENQVCSHDLPQAIRISVVISTCNRAHELPRLFAALQQQTLNGIAAWELVIVDNRSTDDTSQVVRGLAQSSAFPVVYAFESRQGKSYGLNTGISLARGPIIAFTDDDGVPASDWLERVLCRFEAPEVMCLGGRVTLYDLADASITVRLSGDASVVDMSSFTASNIPIIGCNMAIRATALRSIGPFDADIGPGSRVGVCEDVDILYRLVLAGHSIHYDPSVIVQHNHGRRTADQVRRVLESYSIGRGGFYGKYLFRADGTVLKWAYWEVRRLVAELLKGGFVTSQARAARRQLLLLATGAYRFWRFHARDGAGAPRPTARRVL